MLTVEYYFSVGREREREMGNNANALFCGLVRLRTTIRLYGKFIYVCLLNGKWTKFIDSLHLLI